MTAIGSYSSSRDPVNDDAGRRVGRLHRRIERPLAEPRVVNELLLASCKAEGDLRIERNRVLEFRVGDVQVRISSVHVSRSGHAPHGAIRRVRAARCGGRSVGTTCLGAQDTAWALSIPHDDTVISPVHGLPCLPATRPDDRRAIELWDSWCLALARDARRGIPGRPGQALPRSDGTAYREKR